MRYIYIILIILFYNSLLFSQTILVDAGSSWKYHDQGISPGNNWASLGFNDTFWSSGNAELGYGDNDEATTVSYGGNFLNKHITTYFRKDFNVVDPSLFFSISLEILRDDGAVVYLNGSEVYRTNMPSGIIGNNTPATSPISSGAESVFHTLGLSSTLLNVGTNVIAVEIHQDSQVSSDISFDFKLTGNLNPINASIVRGPYLQVLTPQSVIVKWRTNVPCDSEVRFGVDSNNLSSSAFNAAFSTEHEVEVTGLQANTKYYYSIGSYQQVLVQTSNQYFITSPAVGSNVPTKFWVIGDAGTGNDDQRAVRDAFYNYNGGTHVDGWIMLGDNAYENGLDGEYQNGVFNNMYEQTLENTALWPTVGNHDYANNIINPSMSIDYYSIFTLPNNAQAGGVPSGTEAYYSYDYANIHFVVLDSYRESRDSNGVMANWLKQDLASTNQDWIVAYWHHPPYTKGSHDSDNPLLYDFELPQIREQIIPIIESYGVDLVLCGHSHCYERSFLLNGHYGNSGTLNSSMVLDGGSGSYPLSCPYKKDTRITRSNKGTVFAVVGCSGKVGTTSLFGWPHPAMYKATNTSLGSLSLEINDNRLDGRFISSTGSVEDAFTIMKNTGLLSEYQICEGDSVFLEASWLGESYEWSVIGQSFPGIWVKPTTTSSFTVQDSGACMIDTFIVSVIPQGTSPCITLQSQISGLIHPNFHLIPNPSSGMFTLSLTQNQAQPVNTQILDFTGKLIFEKHFTTQVGENTQSFDLSHLPSGIYLMMIQSPEGAQQQKLVIE